MKKIVLSLAAIALFFSCTPPRTMLLQKRYDSTGINNAVRVLIYKTGHSFKLGCQGIIVVKDKETGKILFQGKRKKVIFAPENIVDPLVVHAEQGNLEINDKKYRGIFEINKKDNHVYVINILSLEEYLFSVVPSEIPKKWQSNALKAQAVAARTYAYYHITQNKKKDIYDFDATTNFQVYKGMEIEDKRTTEAVMQTAGEIITFNDEPILAFFHSTCGGRTIDDRYVWMGSDLEYLVGVKSHFCKESPYWRWQTELSLDEIRNYINKKHPQIGRIQSIRFIKHDGRVTRVVIYHSSGTMALTGNNFRLLFPAKKMKSTYFYTQRTGKGLMLYGRGWGHGVGMCQWSAKGMADKGADYQAILRHFYHNIALAKVTTKNYYANK